MTDSKLPLGEGNVPDKALEELLAAFAGDMPPTGGSEIDLDDPSIDILLGLAPTSVGDPDDASEAMVTTPTPLTAQSGAEHADGLTTEPVASIQPVPPVQPVAAIASADAEAGTGSASARKPIQIGGNDHFADAVYLDEEGADRLRGDSTRSTEASVERTTIRIGDDEIEGSSGGIPTAAGSAGMDPRLRARRIAVKRAVGRRRLKWFAVGAAVVVIVTAALAILGSSLFEVKDVDASGVSGNTKAAYDAAEQRLIGRPVLLVDTNAIEAQLEKNPWIREARVSTDFPDRASIEIVERIPLATYQGSDGRWRIIDVDGAVLVVIDGRPLEFMEITGPGADAEAGGAAGDAFRHAAELVEALSPAVRSRTERVVVSDTGELSLQFVNTEVILGAPENLLDKLTWLEAVLKRDDSDTFVLINATTQDVGVK